MSRGRWRKLTCPLSQDWVSINMYNRRMYNRRFRFIWHMYNRRIEDTLRRVWWCNATITFVPLHTALVLSYTSSRSIICGAPRSIHWQYAVSDAKTCACLWTLFNCEIIQRRTGLRRRLQRRNALKRTQVKLWRQKTTPPEREQKEYTRASLLVIFWKCRETIIQKYRSTSYKLHVQTLDYDIDKITSNNVTATLQQKRGEASCAGNLFFIWQ